MPRKNPYSGKQKKQQLKDSKARKQDGPRYMANWSDDDDTNKPVSAREDSSSSSKLNLDQVNKINEQPTKKRTKNSGNSYLLHFFKESDDVVNQRKKQARRPFKHLEETALEFGVQDFYPPQMHLDFPKRPSWSYNLSKDELDRRENHYFQGYLSEVTSHEDSTNLSYFELNLENWRQLWRVIELSDILLIMADVRFPVVHVSPSLVAYLQNTLHKPVVIVINKIDMVPVSLAIASKRYLLQQFPGVRVVFFTSFLRNVKSDDSDSAKSAAQNDDGSGGPLDFDPAKAIFQKPAKSASTYLGPEQLYRVVDSIVQGKVDLSSWRQRLEEEGLFSCGDIDDCELLFKNASSCNKGSNDTSNSGAMASDNCQEEITSEACGGENLYQDGMVTLGCIGYPNVGKSSVLNALKGKKVVSVSQTPGHTKHLQTIFLSPTVRLCDCPGLVFPSIVPKALQVIAGIFPVAQVREPYSVVQFLAERIDLLGLLKVKPPPDSMVDGESEDNFQWSAFDICEAWAIKCGFFTPKAARPDTYRAANNLLRQAVSGQIRLCLRPTSYIEQRAGLKNDPETQALHRILKARSRGSGAFNEEEEDTDSDEDSDTETNSLRNNPFLVPL